MAAIYVHLRILSEERTFKEREIVKDVMDDDYLISRYRFDRDLLLKSM